MTSLSLHSVFMTTLWPTVRLATLHSSSQVILHTLAWMVASSSRQPPPLLSPGSRLPPSTPKETKVGLVITAVTLRPNITKWWGIVTWNILLSFREYTNANFNLTTSISRHLHPLTAQYKITRLADIWLSPLNIFLCITTMLRPGPGSPLDSNWTRKMEVCAIPSFWCISCIFAGAPPGGDAGPEALESTPVIRRSALLAYLSLFLVKTKPC